MANLNEIRLEIADFLNTNILDFIGLNLWHLIHFISGFILMLFITRFFRKKKSQAKFLLLLGLLIIYEFLEVGFIISGSSFFRRESFLDVFLDLILGMLGGFLSFRFFPK